VTASSADPFPQVSEQNRVRDAVLDHVPIPTGSAVQRRPLIWVLSSSLIGQSTHHRLSRGSSSGQSWDGRLVELPIKSGFASNRYDLGARGMNRSSSWAMPAPRSAQGPSNESDTVAAVGSFEANCARMSGSPAPASSIVRSCIAGLWPMTIAQPTSLSIRCSRPRTVSTVAPYSARSISISACRESTARIPSSVSTVRRAVEQTTSSGGVRLAMWLLSNGKALTPRGASGRS
jgi:hypothetical protein